MAIGGRFLSGLIEWLTGLFGANEAQRLYEQYRGDTEGLIRQVQQEVRGLQLPPGFDRDIRQMAQADEAFNKPEAVSQRFAGAFGDINTQLAGLPNQFAQEAGGINERYDARTANLTAQLEGLGAQRRQDIGREFDEARGRGLQQLQERGLGTTTLTANAIAGNARERSDALNRFEEELRGQKIGLQAGLSGEALAARTGQAQFGAGLGLNALGQRTQIGQFGLDYGARAAQNRFANRFNLTDLRFGTPLKYSDARIRGLNTINYQPPPGNFYG